MEQQPGKTSVPSGIRRCSFTICTYPLSYAVYCYSLSYLAVSHYFHTVDGKFDVLVDVTSLPKLTLTSIPAKSLLLHCPSMRQAQPICVQPQWHVLLLLLPASLSLFVCLV